MESKYLTEYIQGVLEDFIYNDLPFDDTNRKWMRIFDERDYLDDTEIHSIIDSVEVFLEALEELATKDSQYIEIMARQSGRNLLLPESKINEYIGEAKRKKEEAMIQMEAEIQSNIVEIDSAKQLHQNETNQLAHLESEIVKVQNEKDETIRIAEEKAFQHIEQQWKLKQEELNASEKGCELIKSQITQTKRSTAQWQEDTNQLYEKAGTIIEYRKKLVYHILLIAMGVFFSLAEFLLFEEKGLAFVPLVFNIAFVFSRLGIVQKPEFQEFPEFLFSFTPLIIINYEAFLIAWNFKRVWLMMFLVLIFTMLAFVMVFTLIYTDIRDKKKATHHFLLVTVALLVSLFEFLSFGKDGIGPFDKPYGWGWAILPFLCNLFFVVHRLSEDYDFVEMIGFIDGYDGREWQEDKVFLEYLYSTISLVIINGFAIWVHNWWVLMLILIYPVLRIIGAAIYERNH